MKTKLAYIRSNGMKFIMKIDVLFKMHALVSNITVYDEIH